MELKLSVPLYYTAKKGQTLFDIADTFRIPVCLLARENALTEEPRAGQVLRLPQSCGNAYRVKGGESRTLLCGSEESFFARNGTRALYPSQRVYL